MTGLTLGGEGGTAYGAVPSYYGRDTPELSPDTTYLVGRSRVEGLVPPAPDITIGEETTFDFAISSDAHMPNAEGRYRQLRDRLHYANDASVTTGTMLDGTPWFSENHRNETLLIKILPGDDISDIEPVWGLIVGGSDSTERAEPGVLAARISLDVFVITTVSEYPTRHGVRNQFER